MLKLFKITYTSLLFVLVVFSCVKKVEAAKLLVVPLSATDSSVIEVFLDSEGETINAVDGAITLTDNAGDNFKISDLSVGGSNFSLWPRTPSFSPASKSISFVAGTPGGVTGERLLLFKIIASFDQSGTITISPSHLTAYVNDGNASTRTIETEISKVPVWAKSEGNNSWNTIIANDDTAPEPFTIALGQDPSINDGKKFITFNTTDADSGIDYYEVVEGTLPPVRSGTTYVLVNQDTSDPITVKAYDVAGNFRTATLQKNHTTIWVIVGLIILIATGFIFWRRRRASKRNTI